MCVVGRVLGHHLLVSLTPVSNQRSSLSGTRTFLSGVGAESCPEEPARPCWAIHLRRDRLFAPMDQYI